MRTRVDERLRVDAETLRFKYACEDCVHFDPGSSACAEGFPCSDHRMVDLETTETIVFCKSFELA